MAVAIAAVSTEAKIPVFSMNAGSSVFLPKAPYGARFSFSVPQLAVPLATWAASNGIKSVYSLVADYSPGLDGEKAFQGEFKRAGGQIVGSVRVPLNNPDFGSYLQLILTIHHHAFSRRQPLLYQSLILLDLPRSRGAGKRIGLYRWP